MLAFFYRWMLRIKAQTTFREEMLDTFEQGRRDAWQQGFTAYAAFGVREFIGLVHAPGRTRRWLSVAGFGTFGIVVGALIALYMPYTYTSEAFLRVVPGIQASNPEETDRLLEPLVTVVRSRTTLTQCINRFGLYRLLRSRQPIEDVLNHMNDSLVIRAEGLRIAIKFRYEGGFPWFYNGWVSDSNDPRVVAQRATQDVVAMLLDENTRMQSKEPLVGPPSWGSAEHLQLDRELARKEYESLRTQQSEAEAHESMVDGHIGTTLVLLDPASLPINPDAPISRPVVIGGFVGISLGAFRAFVRALRASPLLLHPREAYHLTYVTPGGALRRRCG